jgi:hypothetical protein
MATEGEPLDGVPAAELVALLSVPPEEFVTTRAARVRALRSEGRRVEATALSKVRKPSRLVRTVGEVARRDKELARSAVEAAERAEEAMGGHGEVRSAFDELREVVARMSEAGRAIDATVDRAAFELALRQVLSDETTRTAWEQGRLLELPNDDDATLDELAPRRARRAEGRAATEARRDSRAEPTTLSKAERRALERARSRVSDAMTAVDAARAQHDDRMATSRGLHEQIAELEARAAPADRAVHESAETLEDAERELAKARAVVQELDSAD